MQRLPKYVDTRPHQDASHHTTNVKRLAASRTLETATPSSTCVLPLNAPSTRQAASRTYNGGHSVQDTSLVQEYAAGQAYAQGRMPRNIKAAQIQLPCYTTATVPEYNDRLAADAQLAAVQASKNTYQRGYNTAACCLVCGKPPTFSSGCNCSLTTAQRFALKSTVGPARHTIIPNVNVA